MQWNKKLLNLLLIPLALGVMGQTSTRLGNFSAGTLRVPNSTTLPATCAVGDSYMDTDATTGQRWYLCESTNTWALQGGAGGGGDITAVGDCLTGACNTVNDLRLNPRSVAIATATSITPNGDTSDIVTHTNTQATGTLTVNAPSGTPVAGQTLELRIKATNVQTYAWNAIYRGWDALPLPTASSSGASDIDYYLFVYNATDTKWDLAGVTSDAYSASTITESQLSLSDVTTADVNTSRHGFVPKAPNDQTKYLRGDGTWAALSGSAVSGEGARVRRNAAQTGIVTATDTPITFDTETLDNNNYWDAGSPTRLTISADGWYIVQGFVNWDTNTTGTRRTAIWLDGVAQRCSENVAAADDIWGNPICVIYVTAGQYFELYVTQTSGGNRQVDSAAMAILRYVGGGISSTDLRATLTATQTIAAGNTVAADACGGIKRISSAGAVTTDTTNTFTAPASGNSNCVMDVCNVGSNNITLDNNASFKSFGAADVVLTADDCVRVGSTGASGVWYQLGLLVGN